MQKMDSPPSVILRFVRAGTARLPRFKRRPDLRRGPSSPQEPRRATPQRLLILTPFPPSLEGHHGGARVIAQFIVHLGDQMSIAVLCLRHPTDVLPDNSVLDNIELFEQVPRPAITSRPSRAVRAVRWRLALLRGWPFWASELNVPEYRDRLKDLMRSFRPDVIQIEYPVMAQYAAAITDFSHVPRVLVEHDPEVGSLYGNHRATVRDRLEALAWKRFARRALRQVDAAVVFTEQDHDALAPMAGETPIVRIPIGTDFVERAFEPVECDGSLLFVGSFVHAPNVEAVRRLIESIFPRVRETHPDCKLVVVGKSIPADILQAKAPGVVLTGWVEDVIPYVRRAAVVVAPMQQGGGMRVKVLEALAAQKAVVASPLAVAGLDVIDGKQLRIAHDDSEFAARVVELLDDAEERQALANRARSWALDNLHWTGSIRAYERLYAQLVAHHPPLQADHRGPRQGSRSQSRTIHSP